MSNFFCIWNCQYRKLDLVKHFFSHTLKPYTMKYSILRRLGFIKNLTHGLFLFSALIFCDAFAKGISNTNMYGNGRGFSEYDGEKDDTIVHQIGDTIDIYTSGLDTVYITYAEPMPDSLLENGWVINNPNKQMVVELHHQNAPVNQGSIGVNLTDFFEPNKAAFANNTNYTEAPDPWEAVSALAPKTIRIFSGASAKFMHPMGSYDPVENISYGGYGYNWKEMISYFDMSDDLEDAPEITPGVLHYDEIEEQLQDPDCVGCSDWIDSRLTKRFQDFYQKCIDQPTYNAALLTTPETRPLYINELILLIEKIEHDNPGHDVEVIYCVNIESQSTTEMLEVIDYLWDKGVNLIGVEMGNEVANTFGELSMGFSDFDHYWDYINGGNYEGFGGTEEDELRDALQDVMEDDHNFLEAIKGHSAYYHIKIGLPAMNTPNCGASWGFNLLPPFDPYEEGHTVVNTTPPITEPDTGIEDCECDYPDWNVRMAEFYDEVSSESFYLFDAIVFHPYYTTTNTSVDCEVNSNWRDLMLQLHPGFGVGALEGTEEITAYLYTPEWEYATVDEDLEIAFLEISGIPADDLKPGNFKEFVLDGIDHSFTEHAHQMQFTDSDEGPTTKEIWITEYNLDDEVVLVKPPDEFTEVNTARFKNFEASISNTFAHAVLLQNWFLWNVKMSYDPDYSSNLITRTTIQNFLGGSSTMLMTNSQQSDQEGIGEIVSCDSAEIAPYFVRRAAYYAV